MLLVPSVPGAGCVSVSGEFKGESVEVAGVPQDNHSGGKFLTLTLVLANS